MAKQQKKQEPQITEAEIVTENTPATGLVVLNAETQIKKYDIADAAIDEMLKKSKKIKLKSDDDTEGFELVKAAHSEYVSTRTAIDATRKEINKPFSEIISSVNAEGKRLTEKFAKEEQRLKADKERFLNWQREEELRLFREAEARKAQRIKSLQAAGISFDGEMYAIAEISVDIVTIGKMSDEDFEFLHAKVKVAKQKIDDAAAQEKAEREAAEAEARAAAAKVEQDRIALRNEKLELRGGALEDLGYNESAEGGYFRNENGREYTFDFIAELSNEEFKALLQKIREQARQAAEAAAEAEAAAIAAASAPIQETEPAPAPVKSNTGTKAHSDADIFEEFIRNLKMYEAPKYQTAKADIIVNEFMKKMDALISETQKALSQI